MRPSYQVCYLAYLSTCLIQGLSLHLPVPCEQGQRAARDLRKTI